MWDLTLVLQLHKDSNNCSILRHGILKTDTGCFQIQGSAPSEGRICRPLYVTALRWRLFEFKHSYDATNKCVLLICQFEGLVWWILLGPQYPIMPCRLTGFFFFPLITVNKARETSTVLNKNVVIWKLNISRDCVLNAFIICIDMFFCIIFVKNQTSWYKDINMHVWMVL